VSALDFVDDELAALEALGRRRGRRVIGARAGAELVVDGRRVISFSSNDYLGLAADARLAAAATAAMDGRGVGAGASRLITGNLDGAAALEGELARFHGAGSACLFNTGYAANTGTVPVLVSAGDVVFSDELNHASLIDGCRLSRARVVVYRHGDVGDLRAKLGREQGRRRLVITESVFSMDGDVAPLADLREAASAAAAMLMVDDAHAVGCMGGGGRGLGWAARADVVVGTLGKAFGSAGAYVLGPAGLADLLWNRARPLVFSTGLPVPALAASRAALEIVASAEGDQRRRRLDRHMATVGRVLGRSVSSPIVPLLVGDDRRAMECTAWLLEHGFLVQGIRPPTVPVGTARLRLSLSAAHDEDQVEGVLRRVGELIERGWVRADVPRGT